MSAIMDSQVDRIQGQYPVYREALASENRRSCNRRTCATSKMLQDAAVQYGLMISQSVFASLLAEFARDLGRTMGDLPLRDGEQATLACPKVVNDQLVSKIG